MLAVLAVLWAVIGSCVWDSSSRDEVPFTLTFEDMAVPELMSYKALSLYGKGFDWRESGATRLQGAEDWAR